MPLKFMRRIPGSGDHRRNKDDPEYEEVGPVTIHLKHTPDGRGDGKHCEVCGSAQAVVKCANCSGQVFCEACDEVFHRHPRRTQHCRRVLTLVSLHLSQLTDFLHSYHFTTVVTLKWFIVSTLPYDEEKAVKVIICREYFQDSAFRRRDITFLNFPLG
ncbi:hypothetical protein FHG87_010865 [Trinorchestia longiramus]|nr:hypothetical protein FHG87_010865 [Trinorchestia longiramus]